MGILLRFGSLYPLENFNSPVQNHIFSLIHQTLPSHTLFLVGILLRFGSLYPLENLNSPCQIPKKTRILPSLRPCFFIFGTFHFDTLILFKYKIFLIKTNLFSLLTYRLYHGTACPITSYNRHGLLTNKTAVLHFANKI